LSFFGLLGHSGAQEKVTLKEVRIQGNLRVEEEGIRLHVKARPGEPFDPALAAEDVKAIYRMGFFDDVKAELSPGGILTYVLAEKPYVRQVTVQGHSNISRDRIETQLGVAARTILDRDKIVSGIERVKKLYSEQGYVNARVDFKIEPMENNQATVIVTIEEGNRLLIERIAFEGNRAFSDKTLKGLMATKEKWFLSFLTSRGVLDQDALTNDIAVLSSHYYDHGYINHRLDEPIIVKGRDGIDVTIRIHEGDVYRVGKVEIGGELIDQPEKLLEKVQLTTGQIFRGSRLREDISALTDIYSNRGFAFAEVEPVTKINADEKNVNIALMVTRGPPVYLNRVLITGNTKTRDKVIRREIQIAEQELFRGGKLKTSRDALQRTGYFQDVQLTTQKSERPDMVDLTVDVKEGPTGSFSIGAGYSSGDQFIFSSSISERNLFGTGRSVSAGVELGTIRQDFLINFTEPYLLDTRLSLGVDLFNTEREFIDFTSRRTGFGLRTGYPLSHLQLPFFKRPPEDDFAEDATSLLEYMRAGVAYDLVRGKISDVDPLATQAIQDEKGSSITSSITPQLSYDSRDHFFNPTRGTQSSVAVEFAGIGGDNRFIKTDARARWYYALLRDPRWGGDYTLSLGGTLGYGVGLKRRPSGDKNLPLFERYFPGGINSIRGFSDRSLGPREDGDPIGGDKQVVLNAELLFPLYESYGLRGVAFFDMGQAFKHSESIDPGDFRRSVGFGARWLSPFGPLRIELGFPLNKKSDDDTSLVGFSFGGLP
jgi:outer membrane protein insertion porin family